MTGKAVRTANPQSEPAMEMAWVLFMDLVGFSRNSMEHQREALRNLQEIVRETRDFKLAEPSGELVKLPTGDGMALVFFHDPVAPVRCAIEIQRALRAYPDLPLRIGIHTGPVFRHSDIKDNTNVVGGGINIAQRVMDCGDAGHILVSRAVADVLEQMEEWAPCLHDLGTVEVKHGVRLQLFNIVGDGAGNANLPSKVSSLKQSVHSGGRPWWPAAAVIGAVLLAGGGWVISRMLPKSDSAGSTAAAIGRTLRYHIDVQRFRDGRPYKETFRLSRELAFESDYRVRIVVSGGESGHLYVLNEGPQSTESNPDLNFFFPTPQVRAGSGLVQAGQEISIPNGDGFLQLDNEKGKEKLWLIWSTSPVPELEALKAWANPRDKGVVGDGKQARAVALLLREYVTTGRATSGVDEARKETTVSGPGPVVVKLIELEHV